MGRKQQNAAKKSAMKTEQKQRRKGGFVMVICLSFYVIIIGSERPNFQKRKDNPREGKKTPGGTPETTPLPKRVTILSGDGKREQKCLRIESLGAFNEENNYIY